MTAISTSLRTAATAWVNSGTKQGLASSGFECCKARHCASKAESSAFPGMTRMSDAGNGAAFVEDASSMANDLYTDCSAKWNPGISCRLIVAEWKERDKVGELPL